MIDQILTAVLKVLALLALLKYLTHCAPVQLPQIGAVTTIEYEYKGRPVTREQLQRMDDRAMKRLEGMNQ